MLTCYESFLSRGHGLDQIERTLARMGQDYSIVNGMVYKKTD